MKSVDYSFIGRKYGNLTVIDFDHIDDHGNSYWLCECGCGNKKVVSRNALIRGNTSSCGCFKRRQMENSLVGMRFGRLVVLRFDHVDKHHSSYWLCRCDCGNEKIIQRSALVSGATVSCGCNKLEKLVECVRTHGLSYGPIYSVWSGMRQRCNNPNDPEYDRYGGRGIQICEEWDDYKNFHIWATNHGYEKGLSIDRVDNDGMYEPDNCRWADRYTQANNTSQCHYITYNGEKHTLAEWCRILGVGRSTLIYRLNKNNMKDFEEYFETKGVDNL